MRTRSSAAWVGLWLGVSVGCSAGDNSDSTSFGPGPWQLPGDSEHASDGATGGSTGAADGNTTEAPMGSTSAAMTSGPPPSDGTGVDPSDSQGGTFGGNDDAGMQPDSGWWAHCIPNQIACDAGFSCLSTDAGNDGVCTSVCNPAGNPGSCGASPGGTAQPVCLSVGGDSVCALGCEGGLTCPGGMICVNESDDQGPISICI